MPDFRAQGAVFFWRRALQCRCVLANKESRAKFAKLAKVKCLKHDEIAPVVGESAFGLDKGLGPGLLESVDAVLLADALRDKALSVER